MTDKAPVHIRRNVESFDDPYINDESLEETSVCRQCGSIYMSGRWYMKGHAPGEKLASGRGHETLCPACRKQRDRVPSGILKITGDFMWNHKDEVLNLIRNETSKAQTINPLERIMSIESDGGEMLVSTTNEKLAQKIGRALYKAYSGHIEYKWSGDTKHARVNWHRNA